MDCTGKVVLVTGAASGIGAASCRALAARGAKIALSDIDVDTGEALVNELRESGAEAAFIPLDVRDEAQWRTAVDQVLAQFGALDGLVNNAGIAAICGIEEETLEGWRRTQDINTDAVFLGCREAVRVMKGRGGSIVNVSSIEGIVGDPMLPAYNASKGAVRALTKSLALYCAENGTGIRVNSLHPGYVATPLVSGALDKLAAAEAEAFANRVVASIPMGRMAEADEIAEGVVFLISESSRYMTGSELIMDGGYTAR
ncbi:SDR family oxidoreductase [Spongiibacter nanhainus]|uniref:SDR family oxidoreductase n=1 Tax=Spongiibacter nanhainus TaxID=2794344 RepID=A0A7T4URA2_9GAMM|nr:glucose 1-dehydrogenase [Spongiibacter nanhainus]QQD19013.1 SDR family oxidoreductase [Spongiibacter nanhainus]